MKGLRNIWVTLADRVLLGVISLGVIGLLGAIIYKGGDGWDVAAFLLVLQSVIGAIKDGQSQHSVDKMAERQMAPSNESQPVQVMNPPSDPVPTVNSSLAS